MQDVGEFTDYSKLKSNVRDVEMDKDRGQENLNRCFVLGDPQTQRDLTWLYSSA